MGPHHIRPSLLVNPHEYRVWSSPARHRSKYALLVSPVPILCLDFHSASGGEDSESNISHAARLRSRPQFHFRWLQHRAKIHLFAIRFPLTCRGIEFFDFRKKRLADWHAGRCRTRSRSRREAAARSRESRALRPGLFSVAASRGALRIEGPAAATGTATDHVPLLCETP